MRRRAPSLDVLVAEDNPISQMLVAALVRRMGHRVTVVANGRDAVEAAAAHRFDAILMDMQMPELDGLAATRAIRSSGGRASPSRSSRSPPTPRPSGGGFTTAPA